MLCWELKQRQHQISLETRYPQLQDTWFAILSSLEPSFLISSPQLLPRLLKESIKPPSAKRGSKDFIRMDPPIFTRGLPGGSSKTRLAGHAAYRMMLPQHSKLHSTSFQNFRFSHINVAYLTQKFYIYRFARKVLFSFLHKVL